ncbi:MAG: VWA domain-containing protein, partial [Anaerolineae bacterium]
TPGSEGQGTGTLGMLDIIKPTDINPAYAGPHDNPTKIIVRVTKPEDDLVRDDFVVEVGGVAASIVTLYQGSDEYVLEVLPPLQDANGPYDLSVSALVGTVTFPDSEPEAVLYDNNNNVDVVLVIDRSGSMGYGFYGPFSYMEPAKNSAKLFVDLMNDDDRLGVVSFDNEIDVPHRLSVVNSYSRDAAKQAIDDLFARNRTSIGGGLAVGLNELVSNGTASVAANHPWAMVLLSDGQENTAPFVADVLPDIQATRAVVHTVALGEYSDEALMLDIAAQTGGTYSYTPAASRGQLASVYNTIAGEVSGQQTLFSQTGIVQPGETDEKSVIVDSTIHTATFSISWSDCTNSIDLTLEDPNGTVIDSTSAISNSDVIYVSGSTYAYYRIQTSTLITGVWKMMIDGGSIPMSHVPVMAPVNEEHYTALVTGRSTGAGLTLRAYFDKPSYAVNDPIKLSATLSDEEPILGIEVVAIVGPLVSVGPSSQSQAPADSSSPILVLYDDGLHGDGRANNGVYANTLSGINTANEGAYNFQVSATRTSNNGEAFARTVQRNVNVGLESGGTPIYELVHGYYLPLLLRQ